MKRTNTIFTILCACLLGLSATGALWAEEENGQPLTLEDCIQLAVENNPQIISSEQGIVSARAGVTRARSSYYPQLSLSASEGVASGRADLALGGDAPASHGSDRREELDLSLGMTLWRSGRSDSVRCGLVV